uniref:TLDc domain-containing protein n=1 Tax=Brassica oleracea var. oleracea TaxID=109376 RepID=A0A0D3D4F2_BRAOL
MHALKDKVSQKLSNPFADSASSPGYSLTDSPKARFKFSGKTFSSYFPFGVRQSGNENEEEESESCPPKHGNGKHQAATMISSGQDKDSELHVSVKVESDYNEGGSTLKHGISLRTLLRRSADLPGPCLLVCLLACLFDTFLRQSYGLKATSGPSETFGNECLASSTEFELKNVELWGFAHASQYLFS